MSAPESPKMSPDERAYLEAAAKGDLETVRNLLSKGVAVDVRDSETWALGLVWNITALMCAAAKGHLDIVNLLLQSGANVSAACDAHKCDGGSGSQALHFAMGGGHNAVGEALLKAGADPNAIGKRASTPLTQAIKNNNLDGVRLLLRSGADVKLKPKAKDYESPLYVAAGISIHKDNLVRKGDAFIVPAEKKSACLALLDVLLEAGANVDGTGARKTPAIITLSQGQQMELNELRIPLIEKLLKAGAKADLPDKDGDTALYYAVCFNNPEVVRLLCQAGADVNRLSEKGTPLDRAEQDLEACRQSLANPNLSAYRAQDEQRQSRVESVRKTLLEFGAKRKEELEKAPPAPPAEKKTATTPPLGAAHFLKFIYDGEAEWSLLAVKAPIEQVADAYAKFSKAKKWTRQVPIQAASNPSDEVAPAIAAVRIKDNPWTVVFRSLFHMDEAAANNVMEGGKVLATQLKTKAIAFIAEDTSGHIGCEIFEGEKKSKRKDWGEDDSGVIDKFFRREEIYLPACYPTFKDENFWLAVEGDSKDSIERADLIFI